VAPLGVENIATKVSAGIVTAGPASVQLVAVFTIVQLRAVCVATPAAVEVTRVTDL